MTKLRELIALLKDLGFSSESLRASIPSFVKNLAPFLFFAGSLAFFGGFVYFEAAISLLPAPLRMGLHRGGGSLVPYLGHGLTVLTAMAADYREVTYLVGLLTALAIYWLIIRLTSLTLALTNPLTPLRRFVAMPEEKRSALAGEVVAAALDGPNETQKIAFRIFKAATKLHALLRMLDLWLLILLIIYVLSMTLVFVVDALSLVSIVGNKCLSVYGAWFDNSDARAFCRDSGFVEPEIYWRPAFALVLIAASWFSLRHTRTLRVLRIVTIVVASIPLLLFSISFGEQNGSSELSLWRVQIAGQEVPASDEAKEWLLVNAGTEQLILFDEDTNTLHDYRSGQKPGLIFLEKVPFGTIGKGRTVNSRLQRTADATR
jgi:hypothetical protein